MRELANCVQKYFANMNFKQLEFPQKAFKQEYPCYVNQLEATKSRPRMHNIDIRMLYGL